MGCRDAGAQDGWNRWREGHLRTRAGPLRPAGGITNSVSHSSRVSSRSLTLLPVTGFPAGHDPNREGVKAGDAAKVAASTVAAV